jgi:hypothetical protein
MTLKSPIASVRVAASATWIPEEGSPDVSSVAPLLRRRMSPLARMAVSVGLSCCRKAGLDPSEPRVVFASRHGEMGVTSELLAQMGAQEILSPTGFSNSVHHTAVGYFSLATGNRQAMRAIGGGEASFCYGFLDALGLLNESNTTPVLLIAADDQVPPSFDVVIHPRSAPYAAAMLLQTANPKDPGQVTFQMAGRGALSADQSVDSTPALSFLQWMSQDETSFERVLSRKVWRWEK